MNKHTLGTPIEVLIERVQTQLLYISRDNPEIVHVNIDGIYGPATERSVISFQRYYGLPESGEVDYETFTLLNEEYEILIAKNASPEKAADFTRSLSGDQAEYMQNFDLVQKIQMMLNTLAIIYDYPYIEENGIYDDLTRQNIVIFQNINGLEESGTVDRKTWNRLARVYEKYIDSE